MPLQAYDAYEPNDDAFHATPINPAQKLEANIMDGADIDYYRLSNVPGKKAIVHIENRSAGLTPRIEVLNASKQYQRATKIIRQVPIWICCSTPSRARPFFSKCLVGAAPVHIG